VQRAGDDVPALWGKNIVPHLKQEFRGGDSVQEFNKERLVRHWNSKRGESGSEECTDPNVKSDQGGSTRLTNKNEGRDRMEWYVESRGTGEGGKTPITFENAKRRSNEFDHDDEGDEVR